MKGGIVFLASFASVAVGFRVVKNENGDSGSQRPRPTPAGGAKKQYTPNLANWSKITEYQNRRNPGGHDPASANLVGQGGNANIYPISAQVWAEAKWDGRTIYNPTRMKKQDFYLAICPQRYLVRGLRQVFEGRKPFRNNRSPTKAEIDDWHRVMVNHVRALVGYNESNRKIRPDGCLHARALWAEERRFTTKWDRRYPNSSYGSAPCGDPQKSGPHCGATFIPIAQDQPRYLPSGPASCTRNTPGGDDQRSEGTFFTSSSENWSIKWARSFCQTLRAEGFWGAHTNPYFNRELFGWSFQDAGDQATTPWYNKGGTLRAKWGGRLNTGKHQGNYLPG